LFRLSFAALLDRRHTYFVERYRLHYVPSGGSLLYLQSGSKPPRDTARYLFVADPTVRATAPGAPASLPGAAREASIIAGTLPPGTSTTLTGPRATEDRLRSVLPGQTVVHLATHGQLSDKPGVESFLTLSSGGQTAVNDGRLTTREIYDLKLDADLVVLSACRSARGPVTGDGVLGMTRAFLYAGAPSIVASLWDVADRSGPELMPAFYRHWQKLADKAAALREAQLELIARLRARRVMVETPAGARALPEHPFLWAPFILVGEI
jgi:CHAT domain-containing protein